MGKFIRNTLSPQMLAAVIAAASFVVTPLIAQAGGKGDPEKTEKIIKKSVLKKIEITKREASKPATSDVSKTKKPRK